MTSSPARSDLVSLDRTGTAGGELHERLGGEVRGQTGGRSCSPRLRRPSTADPYCPALSSLFVARLTPYYEADLAVTARMAEAPPAGAEWAVELSIADRRTRRRAGVTNVAYTIRTWARATP